MGQERTDTDPQVAQAATGVPVRKEVAERSEDGLRAIATKLSVDRDGEVVMPRGVEPHLDQYKKNPVLLFQHDRSIPPIGKAGDIVVTDDDITYVPEFGRTPFARELKALWDDGILNASSIGFMPVVVDQKAVLPNQTGITHREWSWLETSLVSIPANQDALRRAMKSVAALEPLTKLIATAEHATVLGKVSGSFRGETKAADGHSHSFIMEVADGSVVHAATSVEVGPSGEKHFHWISSAGMTEMADNHAHQIELVAPIQRSVQEEGEKDSLENRHGQPSHPAFFSPISLVSQTKEYGSPPMSDDERKAAAVAAGLATLVDAGAYCDDSREGTVDAAKLVHHPVSKEGIGEPDLGAVVDAIGRVLTGDVPEAARGHAYDHLASHLKELGTDVPPLRDWSGREWSEVRERLLAQGIESLVNDVRDRIERKRKTAPTGAQLEAMVREEIEAIRIGRIRGQ